MPMIPQVSNYQLPVREESVPEEVGCTVSDEAIALHLSHAQTALPMIS